MSPENFYHISLKLVGQRCLVVGGGTVAERKVKALLECGAKVIVVSPDLIQGLGERVTKGEILHKRRRFEPRDLDGMLLVISATDDKELNVRIAELCRKRGILVNVVDNPELSTFYVPASVRRRPICISVSTGGTSPLLARRIREYLESQIGPEFGELAVILGALREQMKKRFPEQEQRQQEWEKLLPENVIEQTKAGKLESIRKLVEECILSQSE